MFRIVCDPSSGI